MARSRSRSRSRSPHHSRGRVERRRRSRSRSASPYTSRKTHQTHHRHNRDEFSKPSGSRDDSHNRWPKDGYKELEEGGGNHHRHHNHGGGGRGGLGEEYLAHRRSQREEITERGALEVWGRSPSIHSAEETDEASDNDKEEKTSKDKKKKKSKKQSSKEKEKKKKKKKDKKKKSKKSKKKRRKSSSSSSSDDSSSAGEEEWVEKDKRSGEVARSKSLQVRTHFFIFFKDYTVRPCVLLTQLVELDFCELFDFTLTKVVIGYKTR